MTIFYPMVLWLTMAAVFLPGVGSRSASAQGPSDAKAAAAIYPKDVDPESRFRLPLVKRDQLDADGKTVYDGLLARGGRNATALSGPNAVRMHSPKLAGLMSAANEYLRSDETGLGARLTELAILVAAREVNSQYEWTAHETAGLRAGLEQEIIDLVKYRKPIAGLGEKEAAIIRLGREMLSSPEVSSQTFADARRLFGNKQLVDVAQLMSYYAATGAMLRAFDMQLNPNQEPLLPLP